ncbi:hypothetical protein EV182_001944 [Spiromyces aspiralis]|uniref:Uncharacterized protein n=1 Tax=Spiromyces aspiralis TaxID=68401 RepID=A0ACC1HSE4_9FUNG|nr:hypothetical protein EV182_001944 [Spiromyces aspiralis]
MNSRFGRLMRASKIASWDPQIPQVYTTHSAAARNGDWGLKYTLPTAVRTKNITVAQLDTKESFPDFESADERVKMLRAWKENFLRSSRPRMPAAAITEGDGINAGQKYNLSQMSEKEWARFLDLARSRSKEWKEAIKRGEYEPHEWFRFMGATFNRPDYSNTAVASPSYHNYTPSLPELRVKGRILNRVPGGYAVGIQGIVALLPQFSKSGSTAFNHREVRDFYVVQAQFDKHGRPDVVVSISPPASAWGNYVPNIHINMGGRGGPRRGGPGDVGASKEEKMLYESLRLIFSKPASKVKSSTPQNFPAQSGATAFGLGSKAKGDGPLSRDPVSMFAEMMKKPRTTGNDGDKK